MKVNALVLLAVLWSSSCALFSDADNVDLAGHRDAGVDDPADTSMDVSGSPGDLGALDASSDLGATDSDDSGGGENADGDAGGGGDADVDAGPPMEELCGLDQRVQGGTCVSCPPGSKNAAGDGTWGPDTFCDPTLCGADEHVSDHVCTPCAAGTTRAPGDDASGADTACDDIVCMPNYFVQSNACEPCLPDEYNLGGDPPSGPDTTCDDRCVDVVGITCPDLFVGRVRLNFTAVDISGDTLVFGISDDSNATGVNGDRTNTAAPGSGAVLVYVYDGVSWVEQAYLKASNTDPGDTFGYRVAIDGDTLVVTAPNEGSGSEVDQTDNSDPLSGAAYVFVRSGDTWTQQAYLKAPGGMGWSFGNGAAIDGNTIAIGQGRQVDLFELVQGSWSYHSTVSPPLLSVHFGPYGLALENNTLAVGDPSNRSGSQGIGGDPVDQSAQNSGAVFVYHRGTSRWGLQAFIKASNSEAGDNFGDAVALRGDRMVVGAQWEDGGSGGIDGDQSDNSQVDSGAAYAFTRVGTTWSQTHYIKAPTPAGVGATHQFGDRFGGRIVLVDQAFGIAAPAFGPDQGAVFWYEDSAVPALLTRFDSPSSTDVGFGRFLVTDSGLLAIGAVTALGTGTAVVHLRQVVP